MGCLANSTAICLFLKSRKVNDIFSDEEDDDDDELGLDLMNLFLTELVVVVIEIIVMMLMMMMIVMIMMMLSVTDPFQLGVDESLPHGACDRSQWQHRPCYKLLFQVIVFLYRNCIVRCSNTMVIQL